VSKKLTTKEIVERAKNIHSNKYDYSLVNYKNNETKIKIICKEHGEFEQTPNSHLNRSGCPICNESKGEREIKNLLNNNNILFETQKKFGKCKYKRILPFDFYLPKDNLCIEFDGEQHFKPIKHWGGQKDFKYRKKLDNIKNNFCKDNNIKLIRIKYNENIKEKLSKFKII